MILLPYLCSRPLGPHEGAKKRKNHGLRVIRSDSPGEPFINSVKIRETDYPDILWCEIALLLRSLISSTWTEPETRTAS